MLKRIFNWIKSLFSRKPKEQKKGPPNEDVVKLYCWVMAGNDQDCHYETELLRQDDEVEETRKKDGAILQYCRIIADTVDMTILRKDYGATYKLSATNQWERVTDAQTCYTISALAFSLYDEWVEIDSVILLQLNLNEGNKPYLEKMFNILLKRCEGKEPGDLQKQAEARRKRIYESWKTIKKFTNDKPICWK